MIDVDVVVIGSGAGGLATALATAQAGLKTLVLEQHYVPGGWCHSFNLGKYRFSPGVHYIGSLEPGGAMRSIYEGMGVSRDLTFLELNPDGYDHVLVGGERFDIPKGREAFGDRLKRRFPAEARGIDRYLDTCQRLSDELGRFLDIRGLGDALALPWRASTVLRWGLRSAGALIDRCVSDPLLKAILAAQSGDHGLPPKMAPALLHASIVTHYFNGGYYPRGGGFAIPRAFVRALKRAGGELRLRTPVARILVEKGRAIGVRLGDGTEVRARHVVSNADPHVTLDRLVGREHLGWRLRRRLDKTRYSVSALSLFFATDMDLRGAGLDSGNYWRYTHSDIDAIYSAGMDGSSWDPRRDEIPGLFLTATTLKDPSKLHSGHHTLEAFTFVSYDTFAKWAHTHYGDRPEDYRALKGELQDRMLDAVDTVVPGLRDRVVFADLGTPLTNVHYVAATRGNLYGTEKSLLQMGPFSYPIRTPIPGLLMCGASTLGHGVAGATFSGLAAAKAILRTSIREMLVHRGPTLEIYPCDDLSQWPERLRPRAPAQPELPRWSARSAAQHAAS